MEHDIRQSAGEPHQCGGHLDLQHLRRKSRCSTTWENYRLEKDFRDQLVVRMFGTQFIRCCFSLFYVAFFKRCADPNPNPKPKPNPNPHPHPTLTLTLTPPPTPNPNPHPNPNLT